MTVEELLQQVEVRTISLKPGDCLALFVPMKNIALSGRVEILGKMMDMLRRKLPKGVVPLVIDNEIELARVRVLPDND